MSAQFQEFVTGIQRLPVRVGSVSPAQQQYIRSFMTEHPEIRTVLETGFHIGLSAATFLDIRPDVNVISFDIFWFDYTRRAKLLLDIAYPGRNLVFIDGGHERPVPAIDLYHILRELPAGTWVMVDDYCEEHGSQGVMEAVQGCADRGELVEVSAYKAADRGWVMGRRSGVPATMPPELTGLDVLLRDTESHYP
jgi:hypothetical protein